MIRKAVWDDIKSLQEIYNEAIVNTVATFDTEIKDYQDRVAWFNDHEQKPYVIFVEEIDGRIAGYASLSRYRDRKAFDRTVEISVYIAPDYRGQGIGKKLVQHTINYGKKQEEIKVIISLITGSNAASIHLHEQAGFIRCGEMKQVGYKHDTLLDLLIFQMMV